jgi:hypothetical protein
MPPAARKPRTRKLTAADRDLIAREEAAAARSRAAAEGVVMVPVTDLAGPNLGAFLREPNDTDRAIAAQIAEAPPAPPRVPVPTAVTDTWFPSQVRLPTGELLHTAKVFATPQGLYVYLKPPTDLLQNPASLGDVRFFSPIDYDKTPRPVTGYAARNAGIPIFTDAGQVTVVPVGGCGCSARRLKNWKPSWSRTSIPWEAAK